MDDRLIDLRRDGRMTDDEFERRMQQARRRAGWELGSERYAGIIIAAFMSPDADREALEREMGDDFGDAGEIIGKVEGEAPARIEGRR